LLLVGVANASHCEPVVLRHQGRDADDAAAARLKEPLESPRTVPRAVVRRSCSPRAARAPLLPPLSPLAPPFAARRASSAAASAAPGRPRRASRAFAPPEAVAAAEAAAAARAGEGDWLGRRPPPSAALAAAAPPPPPRPLPLNRRRAASPRAAAAVALRGDTAASWRLTMAGAPTSFVAASQQALQAAPALARTTTVDKNGNPGLVEVTSEPPSGIFGSSI
jgi:hypothetical protein